MSDLIDDYHDGNRYFHDRFDTRRLADRSAAVRTSSVFEDWAVEFIRRANMFFIATCDHRGLPTCSYKGGKRGFVRVLDQHWLAFPNYDGNGRYLTMGNLRKNPNVGMLFIDFEKPSRVRVQGEAQILEDDELLPSYPGAQFIVRVRATEVFRNCPRYIHRYTYQGTSEYVPEHGHEPPIPEWKFLPELNPYLPTDDPARDTEP
jgi:predicted pyridoxine 5'-phosphate oxidase superfamily flavin-nucleotide-binding protein